ncbi:MAG: response regulator [Candidatus Korobacteraceae bacterium]
MIDVIIADHQELFRVGMAAVVGAADDVRIVGQPESPEQLLNTLKDVNPQVLILSTNFLSAFSKIRRKLKRRQTALLVLTEENDRTAYVRWLQAQGVVYRSMDGPVLVDAMRRVARGELFVQSRSSDMREDPSEVARGLTESRNRIPVVLSIDENSAILYKRYKVLQGAGYGVLSATDGEQAMSLLEAYPVDLVLLDYSMPGTDGETVAHKIKRCKQNVPVIAVSASHIPEETLACADCVVTKTQDPVFLLKKIGQLLDL